MNRTLKRALVATGLIAATGVGAGLVMADGPRACDGGPQMMRAARHGDFKALAEHKLERLHDGLQLRAEQQAEWQAFRTAILGQAGRMGEKARAWRDGPPQGNTLDRLDRAQAGMDEARGALGVVAAATRRFYAALDKEQQVRFDDLTRRFGPGPRGPGGFGPGA